jgi:hypothetical protein
LTNLVRLLLIILGLGFAAQTMGTLVDSLALYLSVGLTALAVLAAPWQNAFGRGLPAEPSNGPRRRFRPLHLLLSFILIAAALVLLSCFPDDRVNRLLSMSILIVGCDMFVRAFVLECREFEPAAAIALFAGIFFLALKYSPVAWKVWQQVSLESSQWVGELVRAPLRLGPTYSGFNVSFLFLLAIFVLFAFTDRRSWSRFILAIVYVAAINFGYLVLMTTLGNTEIGSPLPPPQDPKSLLPLLSRHLGPEFLGHHVPWNLPFVLFIFELPAIWLIAHNAVLRPTRLFPRPLEVPWAAGMVVTLVVGVGLLAVRLPETPRLVHTHPGTAGAPAATAPTRVVFYDKGFLNWAVPNYGAYGAYSTGMFGRLPIFVRQLGFDASLVPHLDNETLRSAQIAVVINPMTNLPDAERRALWQFVRRGGSLLVLGDHTWRGDKGDDVLGHLLEPAAIRFNFDSAEYHIGGWLYGYGYTGDPIYYRSRADLDAPGIGVGASLRLRGKAEPILLGVHGFADQGLETFRPQIGYMGDSHYTPGEPLGDLVLVAQQPYGAGRVIVYADTTPFVNVLMVGAHEPTARLFAKLSAQPDVPFHLHRLGAASFCFLLALTGFLFHAKRSAVPVIVAGLTCAIGLLVCDARLARPLDILPRGEIAYIDNAHLGKFSRESWREDGIAGLFTNLMRSDMQPLLANSLDPKRLAGSRMLFIIAPTRSLSKREADDIAAFIDRGGYVVVSVAPDEAWAVEPLLGRYGLAVRNRPLGQFITTIFGGALRMRFRAGFEAEDKSGKGTVFGAYGMPGQPQVPVVIERLADSPAPAARSGEPPRRGGLLLIGDGQFFLNKNLEREKGEAEPDGQGVVMENINFLRWLIDHVRTLQGAGPPVAGGTP